MRVLVLSQVFHPDHAGIANYSNDAALYLAEQGHDVTVVTSFPWYPAWKKRPEDERQFFATERWKGVKILRGYLYVPRNVNTIGRVLHEFSFLFFALINALKAGQQDVVLAFTTPISLGLLGALIAKLRGAPLLINVQDLQLEAASSLKMVGNSPLLKIVAAFENFSYYLAKRVSSISDGMLGVLRDKGVSKSKLLYWPNWIDVRDAAGMGKVGEFRAKYPQFKGKKLIAYAGNIGRKQGLETFVDLAAAKADDKELAFLIIGGGAHIDDLKTYAAEKGNPVHFMPLLAPEEYYGFLEDVDLLFLSQRKTSKDVYFPSKLLGIWAKSRPVLVAADPASELYRVIEENKLGFVAPFGDGVALRNALDDYLKQSGNDAGKRARKFVERFDRNAVLPEVEQAMETMRGR